MDDTENMQELADIGRELLKKNISRVNTYTGKYEEVRYVNGTVPTNEEELARFAKTLAEERKQRLRNRSASNGAGDSDCGSGDRRHGGPSRQRSGP